ncbi:hypothetical protein JAAARDRAFT_66920 [Jaapia argillacea MUCL 33604]|uniref:Fungal lipase-type domain-containing protein n=1 Tax=Jaapia argillacea MUCL 33604 TaxID=933084 RepID=A0A067QH65_9AGAM|nr:hypothetical protein JAAARDRAFT_66920 [Jaapia argillacea MUCL 33604]
MISAALISYLLAGALFVEAAPGPSLFSRQSITALSTSQITTYRPYTHYASAAYCKPATTLAWNCGSNCQTNPTFKPVASGGDGDSVQFWFVGYDPTLASVIVAHQGTDPSQILDPSLFPGVSSSVTAHDGFQSAQAAAATAILSAVQTAISRYGATQVTVIGHSLGAAIALLDSVYLPLHLPSKIHVKMVGYGMPRVGNQYFANYVDAHSSSTPVTHINNMKDPVPILPGRFLGYHHPSGEIHIKEDGTWVSCPGQDNTNSQCEGGDVSNIFVADEGNHDGPYDGITMGC